jgi:hypothetical protein
MRALLRVIPILIALASATAQAGNPPPLASLPPPIRDYAAALRPYCEQIGKKEVVANGIYSDSFFGRLDVNADGARDYFIYKCMFGCEGEPYGLQGLGPSCMFGSLLLSSGAGYRSVPVPGQLLSLDRAPRLRVAVYRAHIHAQDCGGTWYCHYVYELRDEWFRLVGPCPAEGCRALLAARREDESRKEVANSGEGR